MFVNLHNLPPGHSMFTLTVGQHGEPVEQNEEVDLTLPHPPLDNPRLTAVVMENARGALVREYGPTVEVRFIANQSSGEAIFDCRWDGHIPLPAVLPARITEATERPYDMLLALALDEGTDPSRGAAEYRDFLLERV